MSYLQILGIALIFTCCTNQPKEKKSNESVQPNVESESTNSEQLESLSSPAYSTDEHSEQLINEPPKSAEYEYYDEEISARQTLKVNWLTKDSLEFELSTETELCNYEQSGTAATARGLNVEIDEDEYGMAYPALEYFVVEGGKLWSLRIHKQDRSHAKISYIYEKPRKECSPYNNLMILKPSSNR